MTGPIPPAPAERAATRFVVDENGCWMSTYSLGSHGYAQVGWNVGGGRIEATTAHRAAWTHHFGAIPEGMTIDHLCHVRLCVNPEHLRLLSNFENARRNGADRDWPLGECIRGHSNTLLVTRMRHGVKHLRCGECEREDQRAYRARRAS